MRTWTLLFAAIGLLAARSSAAGDLLSPECWQPFAPRPVAAPASSRSLEGGELRLTLASENRPFVYGGWRCRAEGIEGGSYYRLRALALPVDLASVRESVTVLLRWRGDFGAEVAPTYVWDHRPAGTPDGALAFDRTVQAPARARAVDVELVLQWSRTGVVTFRDVSLIAAPPPPPRKARLAVVWFRPRGSKDGAESVARVAAYADTVAARDKPDVVLLGEMINHAGSPNSLDADAEPIPGPTTERLAALARKHSAYFAFSLVERSGTGVFNTGVLIDRQGTIAGTYRKTQVPFEEVTAGVAPGDVFPVFDADFGRVGLLICHDTSFPEPARELSLAGAELILVPIAGGREALVRARAIENGVYVATSGYDYASEIVDPQGRVLASAPRSQGPAAAVTEVDFTREFTEEWIGNWRDTVNKQRRETAHSRVPR
jgi:predicted amidohydrolase